MDKFGSLLLGLGCGCLIFAIVEWIGNYFSNRRFQNYVGQVAKEGASIVSDATKEVSELMFRDKNGMLCTVKIVIDHAIPSNLHDLLGNHRISEDATSQVQEFIFSPKAVAEMRENGVEPDELVRQMLRAAGRIA